ncbi:MAG: hypothetical protein IJK23_02320 [Clostridia bacterium]|nr:hypothetical protein [Clostridia bacterium]
MTRIHYTDDNIRIEGIFGFDKTRRFRRYPEAVVKQYPRLADADKKSVGARLRFRTDSEKIRVVFTISNNYPDIAMSFFHANSAYAYIGAYPRARYAALITSWDTYKSDTISAEFANDGMNDITVFFPQNPTVEDIEVFLCDGASLLPPTPHRVKRPFVFYGSSITQQGHTLTPLAYPSLLSRFFDADFYNFGASGNAQGEPELAEHLGKIEKSVFFYDYDHNAPTVEHLKNTHEAFFKKFRAFDPSSPVIMTSRPADDTPETEERVAIVRETYENAVKNGDGNVYFIDGRTLFGKVDPAICTTDRTHPNDLGHYLIAKTVEKLIREKNILNNSEDR